MIATMTGSIERNVTPHQEPSKASADCWLALAAAPTFAIMALLTGIHGDAMPDTLCSAVHYASPLGGMVPMYLLMSFFHSRPWLKLVYGQSGAMRMLESDH
jgi:hypothetical protein